MDNGGQNASAMQISAVGGCREASGSVVLRFHRVFMVTGSQSL